jgi:hypothetical protein
MSIQKALPRVDSDTVANLIDVDTSFTPYSAQLSSCYIGGRIPVNSNDHRVDIYVRAPSTKELEVYEAEYKGHKLCTHHYLGDGCKTENCQYYHGVLEPEAYRVLQHKLTGFPCQKGGRCRVFDCPYGHICQREECSREGKKAEGCRLPVSRHGVDLEVKSWVKRDGGSVEGTTAQPATVSVADTTLQLTTLSIADGDLPTEQEDLMK